ncbi:MAG: ABC transporter ATP-binding protein [Planctomycetota bacterium]
MIAFENVAKTYPGGATALDGFSMRIQSGQFVALVGPSGCGKSTALRLAAGLDSPTAGGVTRDPSLSEEGGIGCVFQEPTLMPWARVDTNVRLPLRLRGVSRRESAPLVADALRRVCLTDFARSYPRQLSGGMKMRASVARATVASPRLLLMDEPFAALDEITRFRLNDDLLELHRQQGWACLFVTHSVYEATFLADRVVVMSDRPGRVLADFAVDLPRPRTDGTRSDPAYVQLCAEVSRSLATALGGGEAGREAVG